MQHETPERDKPEMHVPDMSQAAPVNSPYTNEEWKELLKAPVQICRAMIAVSPSGAIGTAREIKAMRACFKETLQGTSNPTLQAMHQQLQGKDQLDSLWNSAGHAFRDRWDAANVRQTAIMASQQCMMLLKKVPSQDALAYKNFVYAAAQKVAEASKEDGIMGFGGSQALSEAEQSLLNDLSKALELPRA